MKTPDIAAEKNLHAFVPPALLAQAEAAAQQEQISLDELAVAALQRHIARRSLERFRREGEMRRRGMTEEQAESFVDQTIHEYRQEQQEQQSQERGR